MSFELPDLPYAYDALQPYMSAETLEYHHDKHHNTYVETGNKLLAGSGLEGKALEDVVKESHGSNQPLFNNAAQHYNHIHFWKWMKPAAAGANCRARCNLESTAILAGSTNSAKHSLKRVKASSVQAGAGSP